jgi:hypothetical protein
VSKKSRRQRTLAKAQQRRDLSAMAANGGVDPRSNPTIGPGNQKPLAPVQQPGGASWLGPGEPITPLAPDEVKGRRWDYQPYYNVTIEPRPYEAVGFHELRAVSQAYDIIRLAIETRKDQMERLTWSFRARTLANGDSATEDDDPAIQELTDFFTYPDGEMEWGTWLRQVLEDMFVVDAVSLYTPHTYGSKLLKLQQVDGAHIARLIDDWGGTPEPPAPAYRGVLHGMPAVYYNTDDLIYMPRNPRVHKGYGFSPVEQVLTTINIGLRRQLFQLNYFTDGNVPDAIIGVPNEWNADMIAKFQAWWDSELSGNLVERRKARFVPGGLNYHPTKDPELSGKFDEHLIRIVCYAFSLPPTPFVAQVNRATAESAHDAALEEGLAPVQNYIKRLVDRVLRKFWPAYAKKIEFAWDDDREVDALVQEQVLTGYATKGIYTIDEVRDLLGKQPMPGGVGSKLKVLTATGYVNVEANDDAPTAGEAADQKAKQAEDAANRPVVAAAPAAPPGNGDDGKKGAAAQKAATFRRARQLAKNTYWGAPRRPHAQDGGGQAGGSAA